MKDRTKFEAFKARRLAANAAWKAPRDRSMDAMHPDLREVRFSDGPGTREALAGWYDRQHPETAD